LSRRKLLGASLGGGAAVSALSLVVVLLRGVASAPRRCAAGFVAGPTRCCPRGQSERDGACVGAIATCPPPLIARGGAVAGCAVVPKQVRIAGGRLELAAVDWEGAPGDPPGKGTVAPFLIDAHEVTHARWQDCVRGGGCRALGAAEPGLPVTGVSPEEATAFCRFVAGRLPRADEWAFAAGVGRGFRYPWGPTGLVCRRAAFGLVAGPCAEGARGPELAGARPDGATPDGVEDLAGNVAEWTVEPDGAMTARGGSYASRSAAELKSWASVMLEGADARVGFRCAYEVGAEPGGG